ncbi:MAG TPA: hypothetical protein VD928_02260 [Candidatus Paceibacterota bacterium]|nr:hypothetical protein [Candidatus Paceibacterota bacterium]
MRVSTITQLHRGQFRQKIRDELHVKFHALANTFKKKKGMHEIAALSAALKIFALLQVRRGDSLPSEEDIALTNFARDIRDHADEHTYTPEEANVLMRDIALTLLIAGASSFEDALHIKESPLYRQVTGRRHLG